MKVEAVPWGELERDPILNKLWHGGLRDIIRKYR